MGALMVYISFVNRDGEALFWGVCLLLPLLIAALLTVSKSIRKISLAIISKTDPRVLLLEEQNVAPSMNPLPVQMSGRGSRLDRYQSVMFRLRLAPSSGAMAEHVMAQCGTQVSLSVDSIEDSRNLKLAVNKGSRHGHDVKARFGLSTQFVGREISINTEPPFEFQMLARIQRHALIRHAVNAHQFRFGVLKAVHVRWCERRPLVFALLQL